MQFNSFSS